jgi:hypothetical protein
MRRRRQRVDTPLPEAAFERATTFHHAEPPRARTALQEYDRALRLGNPRALLPTAMMLDHGVYQGPEPVYPNRTVAVDLYLQATRDGDVIDRARARDRLRELGSGPRQPPPPPPAFAGQGTLPPTTRHAPLVPLRQGPRSDSQNVHDSSVVKSIKKALDGLPYSPLSTEETLMQVRSAIQGNADAEAGLDLVERNTVPLTSIQMKEVDVLRKVWGRIKLLPTDLDQENAVSMLQHRLAESGKEASCASGRVGRIVDALSTFDDHVRLRPTWVLRQEMLSKAASLRRSHQDDDVQTFLALLKDEFRREYVDSGLTTMNFIDAELDSWGTSI